MIFKDRTLFISGDSLVISIPTIIVNNFGLKKGDKKNITFENGKLTIDLCEDKNKENDCS